MTAEMQHVIYASRRGGSIETVPAVDMQILQRRQNAAVKIPAANSIDNVCEDTAACLVWDA